MSTPLPRPFPTERTTIPLARWGVYGIVPVRTANEIARGDGFRYAAHPNVAPHILIGVQPDGAMVSTRSPDTAIGDRLSGTVDAAWAVWWATKAACRDVLPEWEDGFANEHPTPVGATRRRAVLDPVTGHTVTSPYRFAGCDPYLRPVWIPWPEKQPWDARSLYVYRQARLRVTRDWHIAWTGAPDGAPTPRWKGPDPHPEPAPTRPKRVHLGRLRLPSGR